MSYTLEAELGKANAAPGEALVDTIDWSKWRKRAAWVIGIFVLVLAVLVYFYAKDLQHEKDKAEAVNKVQVAPESNAAATPKKPKIATKKVAPKASNTPPIVEFGSMVQKPSEPLSQFEIDVIAFETKLKKDFP